MITKGFVFNAHFDFEVKVCEKKVHIHDWVNMVQLKSQLNSFNSGINSWASTEIFREREWVGGLGFPFSNNKIIWYNVCGIA